jgi:hypothetical protein
VAEAEVGGSRRILERFGGNQCLLLDWIWEKKELRAGPWKDRASGRDVYVCVCMHVLRCEHLAAQF